VTLGASLSESLSSFASSSHVDNSIELTDDGWDGCNIYRELPLCCSTLIGPDLSQVMPTINKGFWRENT
jgi:hypothetical protein